MSRPNPKAKSSSDMDLHLSAYADLIKELVEKYYTPYHVQMVGFSSHGSLGKTPSIGEPPMAQAQSANATTAVVAEPADRFKHNDIHIDREGTKIILPAAPFPMSYQEALNAISRRMKEEESIVSINETIEAFPFDGAYAFMKALQRIYGWATPVPTQTFFGPMPPDTINLEIERGVYTQIIWGNFAIPGIEGQLATGTTTKDGRRVFCIKGNIRKKHMADVAHIAATTRDIIRNESIYRGKAIQLVTNSDGDMDHDAPPKFLDLSRVNPDELVFSDDVARQVQTSLFTPIEHTQACRDAKIPLKRGVLLEGPFGTGKTLTAFVAATKCVKNGWTFVLVKHVAALGDALTFARMYEPCVVFAEDVDRSVAGERSVEMDDILNTIDGVDSKGTEVMVVLTSNDVQAINRAMLRPGRLDAVIPIHAPDAKAVEKLIHLYARNLLEAKANLTQAGKELAGTIPAVIREVVERAKLYAISRTGKADVLLSGDDLYTAACGMKNHLLLLQDKKEEKSEEEKLGAALTNVITRATDDSGLKRIAQSTNNTLGEVANMVGSTRQLSMEIHKRVVQ